MSIVDREAFLLATIFIREAIYNSLRKTGAEKGFISRFMSLFLPSIGDDIVTYNMKWFVSGLLSGILMSLWIPIMIYISSLINVYFVRLTVIASLVMMMLISVLIITDLIHQVVASINELALWKKIEYLPIKHETVEKAASYSVLIGGGASLLLGMGLGIGLIVYAFTDLYNAVSMVPLGFITSTMLVYPIMILLYSKFSGKAPPLISLLIHVIMVVTILSIYLNTLSFGSYDEVLNFIHAYRVVFPFPYIYATIIGYEPIAIAAGLTYFIAGIVLSVTIPSRYGVRLVFSGLPEKGSGLILRYKRLVTAGLKDVLLLLRDATRQKQFYGQIAALATPFVVTILNAQILSIIHGIEYVRSLVLVSFFGLLSYIIAVITTPVLVFIESDRNRILYSLPVNREEVVISKTIASLILYQPIPIILSTLVAVLIGFVHGLITYYTMTMFWVVGAYASFEIILRMLWGKLGAWTEFSLGVLKRLLTILALMFPLGIFLSITLFLYITQPLTALIVNLVTPLPILLYIAYRGFVKD